MNKLIQDHDTENMITFGTLGMLELVADDWISSRSSSSGRLTPSSHDSDTYSEILGAQLQDTEIPEMYPPLAATQPIRNKAGKLLCPLCGERLREFRTLQAFRNHLASPVHAPKTFHCPVDLLPSTRKGKTGKTLIREFSTLSGMAQHIESGACEGGRRMLEGAVQFVEEKLKELGFKEVRLLN